MVKFGGQSLANGEGLPRVLELIADKSGSGERIAVVLSAREKATDQLESLLDLAAVGKRYQGVLEAFKAYQQNTFYDIDLSEEFDGIEQLLEGVALLGEITALRSRTS